MHAFQIGNFNIVVPIPLITYEVYEIQLNFYIPREINIDLENFHKYIYNSLALHITSGTFNYIFHPSIFM